MSIGAFTFVLHSHLPYVCKAGRRPHGEEMIHEAMAETYVPLLNALYELKEQGYNPRLTIGLTPILLEQGIIVLHIRSDGRVQDALELEKEEKADVTSLVLC